LLADAERLESLVELVGASALPDRERVVLLGARLVREAVLQQSALSERDAFCTTEKQLALLEMALEVYDGCLGLLDRGVSATAIEEVDLGTVIRARDTVDPGDAEGIGAIAQAAMRQLDELQ
jgi:V/A-type H+-transporting ATPase subunit A